MERLNLYLDLEPGEFADLEVVAKASLAFAEAVREIAYTVDPFAEIRLELESGSEGSLSINSIVRFVRGTLSDRAAWRTVALATSLWFTQEIASAIVGVSVEKLANEDDGLSDEDVQKISAAVARMLERKVGSEPVREVYRELQKDRNIKGVGVGTEKGARPMSIVPRENFSERSREPQEQKDATSRVRIERLPLTLVSPVLQRSNNKWRFLSKGGTIYVSIKDEKFLNSILSGELNITMKSGIVILADVEIREEKENRTNVWMPTERNLVRFIKFVEDEDDYYSLFPVEEK